MTIWEDYVPIVTCSVKRKQTNARCECPLGHESDLANHYSYHSGRDTWGRYHVWKIEPTQLKLFYD